MRISTALVLSGLALVGRVVADCECGYTVSTADSTSLTLFTDLIESDFTTLKDIKSNTDWRRQEWEIDAKKSRGPYGRSTQVKNVVSNPEGKKGTGVAKDGSEAGLELWVKKVDADDDHVPVAEIASTREDIFYASIRAGIKPTALNGTCGAFFWYLNDTQEIDMEFLSRQFNGDKSPVNLVLHSHLSELNGGDASSTPTYKIVELGFKPSDTFHEYRFDWTKEAVSFYVDGNRIAFFDSKEFIPSAAGKIILSHWSNGNPLWSAGPPQEDAKMVVSYVKAYFNSSDTERQEAHKSRCKDASASNAVCLVPDQLVPPRFDVATHQEGLPYFFSKDTTANKVKGQLVYGKSAGVKPGVSLWALVAGLSIAAVLL